MPPVRMRFVVLAVLAVCAAPAAARAQADEPDADEYAVWSAVLGHPAEGGGLDGVTPEALVGVA